MPELASGAIAQAIARASEAGVARAAIALESLAEAVEEQARANASNGSHPYGTPTPARPGEGPAQISGTLVASIGHAPITKDPAGWATKVGPRQGFSPPYGKRPTPAHLYGYYLETGLRNGTTYPWLKPAADRVVPAAAGILAKAFGGDWVAEA
jgi:hypothetical protein